MASWRTCVPHRHTMRPGCTFPKIKLKWWPFSAASFVALMQSNSWWMGHRMGMFKNPVLILFSSKMGTTGSLFSPHVFHIHKSIRATEPILKKRQAWNICYCNGSRLMPRNCHYHLLWQSLLCIHCFHVKGNFNCIDVNFTSKPSSISIFTSVLKCTLLYILWHQYDF